MTASREFDYAARYRAKVKTSALRSDAYSQLWSIVDGGVSDALKNHPDYLTPKGQRSARTSIVKRVTGTVIGFAEQSAKGRPYHPAETALGAMSPQEPAPALRDVDAGAGAITSAPFRVRIGRIRFKRRTRYRAAQDFDLTTNRLRGFAPRNVPGRVG